MNFNASRNVAQAGGPRKAKRVSDVAAMGNPSATPTFNPGTGYSPGFPPTATPPPYYEGVPVETQYPAAQQDFTVMGSFTQNPVSSPAQLASLVQQPIMQDMALQYGGQLAQQGRAAVERELHRYLPVSRLRYYFAVDTRYVFKKLLLILFPFTHRDWMVKYDQDSPVQPRYDLNAPDLYLPAMGYVTYVLLAGFMLGLQQRFSPEQIGIQASSALAYIVFEMALYLASLQVTGTRTSLRTLDLLAFAGYKYASMIVALLAALLLGQAGYGAALLYTTLTLAYFLVKTLRVQVLSGAEGQAHTYGYAAANPYADAGWGGGGGGTKRRVYFLLFVALMQPLLCWWLTYHLVPASRAPVAAILPAATL